VAVFDVLRATTSIVAALHHGAQAVVPCETHREVVKHRGANVLLAGERDCLPYPGFDFGNSPGDFIADAVDGKTIVMATTNGTRALLAARRGRLVLAAALVNATATAEALAATERDVTLLAAGTKGRLAVEDLCGAAQVMKRLLAAGYTMDGDAAKLTLPLADADPREVLTTSTGGQDVQAAGLAADIAYAARVDVLPTVAQWDPATKSLRAIRA
jgi:2-phosphosulfolactate phosphatase